jgi:NNP family nitrate/nitrite transporter-like MFS transporter
MAMGFSMGTFATYSGGFIIYGITSVVALGVLLVVQHRWTRSWVGKGGKALTSEQAALD